MLNKKTSITSSKFSCKNCNFICSKKGDYNRHLATAKHSKLTKCYNMLNENTFYTFVWIWIILIFRPSWLGRPFGITLPTLGDSSAAYCEAAMSLFHHSRLSCRIPVGEAPTLGSPVGSLLGAAVILSFPVGSLFTACSEGYCAGYVLYWCGHLHLS